jgi:hypothetical protein
MRDYSSVIRDPEFGEGYVRRTDEISKTKTQKANKA